MGFKSKGLWLYLAFLFLPISTWAQSTPDPVQWAPDLTLSVEKIYGEFTYWRQTPEGYESGFIHFDLDHTWTLVSHFDVDHDQYTDSYRVTKGQYALGRQEDGTFGFWMEGQDLSRIFLQDVQIVGGKVVSFIALDRSFTRRQGDSPYFVMEGNQPNLAEELRIESEPVGAAVFLDGNRIPGTTPLTISKPSADVPLKIRVMFPGYSTREETVNLRVGERKQMQIKLLRGEAAIRITSLPGVQIRLDDQWLGRTPISLDDLPAGKHKLFYYNQSLGIEQSEEVELVAGQILTKKLTFTGRLIIDVGRPCKMYRHDRLTGTAPFDGQVPVGRHVLILVDDQGEKRRLLVDVNHNQTTEIKKPFESLPSVE